MGRQFARQGLGFMTEATAVMVEDVKAGRLVQVLPNLKMRPLEVYAVYPANAPMDSPARLFIEHMTGPSVQDLDWAASGEHLVGF
jgi:DNA-binding transcriptional LysR family regulator